MTLQRRAAASEVVWPGAAPSIVQEGLVQTMPGINRLQFYSAAMADPETFMFSKLEATESMERSQIQKESSELPLLWSYRPAPLQMGVPG